MIPRSTIPLAFGLVVLATGSAPCAQERILTTARRTHFAPAFSPDGKLVAYGAKTDLYVRPNGAGQEGLLFSAGVPFRFLWESSSATLLVHAGDSLLRVDLLGKSKVVASLKGKGVASLTELSGDGKSVYGVRRVGFTTIVVRVDLATGAITDLIKTVPGVSDVDLDRSGQWLLISATPFLGQWTFYKAKVDGTGLSALVAKPLNIIAEHGRWVDAGRKLVFGHAGMLGQTGGGFQLWGLDSQTSVLKPLTWLPRQRKGVPSVSPDGKWIAVPEIDPSTGASRVLLLPSDGGGEHVLIGPLHHVEAEVRFSADGKSLVYTGAAKFGGTVHVRAFDLDRPIRVAPSLRPAGTGSVLMPVANGEVGVLLLGFGLAKTPLGVPPLTGSLALDTTLPVLTVATSLSKDLAGAFAVPNDTGLVGKSFYGQGARLLVGASLRGGFTLPLTLDVLPK